VVGEIQKAYNAYAGILKREADEAYEAAERLRTGPIAMPKDREWQSFVYENEQFVDPRIPIRRAENIYYPGKDSPAAAEVRTGMLERKSKYLKSYTPGWSVVLCFALCYDTNDLRFRYVLSPTHLHEFKSADHISAQQPIMSLYLPEQKLGSRSSVNSSSHKFMLKGRQTGGMHRGHAWVFRAESYDTMMAWYEDIKNLTEKTGEERNAFVRRHARSISGGSYKPGSVSSDGVMDEDEADEVPYSANTSQVQQMPKPDTPARPQPGGRFPSDLQVNRFLQVPLSPSSATSSGDHDPLMADNTQPESSASGGLGDLDERKRDNQTPGQETVHAPVASHRARERQQHNLLTSKGAQVDRPDPSKANDFGPGVISNGERLLREQQVDPPIPNPHTVFVRRGSDYATWMAPGAAGNGVADAGSYRTESYHDRPRQDGVVQYHEKRRTSNVPDTGVVTGTSKTTPMSGAQLPNGESLQNRYTNPTFQPNQARDFGTGPSFRADNAVNKLNTDHAGAWNTGSEGYESIESVPAAAGQPRQLQRRNEAGPFEEPIHLRPNIQSHKSVHTISDLHVPGEFPQTPTT